MLLRLPALVSDMMPSPTTILLDSAIARLEPFSLSIMYKGISCSTSRGGDLGIHLL